MNKIQILQILPPKQRKLSSLKGTCRLFSPSDLQLGCEVLSSPHPRCVDKGRRCRQISTWNFDDNNLFVSGIKKKESILRYHCLIFHSLSTLSSPVYIGSAVTWEMKISGILTVYSCSFSYFLATLKAALGRNFTFVKVSSFERVILFHSWDLGYRNEFFRVNSPKRTRKIAIWIYIP